MRKFLTITIPIVTIALFVCIMLSGSFLKKPFNKNEDIPKKIEVITQYVNNEEWQEASDELETLDKAWRKMISRIQFSSERDEINYLSVNIARLRGAIQAEDKSSALMELYEANNHWKTLGE